MIPDLALFCFRQSARSDLVQQRRVGMSTLTKENVANGALKPRIWACECISGRIFIR